MRKAVIFGGGGFIGSNFYSDFKHEYDQIVIVDRFYGPSHPSLADYHQLWASLRPQDRIITADAGDVSFWPQLLGDATDVFLLNADTGTGNSFDRPSATMTENLVKLAKLVEAIRLYASSQFTRVIFTSSRAVYGEGHWRCVEHGKQTPVRTAQALAAGAFAPRCAQCDAELALHGSSEDDALQPLSVYGLTKAAGEKLLELTLCPAGFDVRIVRFQNVYGIGQAIDNPYTGVLNWFSRAFIEGNAVKVFEEGRIVRDFIFVSDAVELLNRVASADFLAYERIKPFVVNGGTGVPTRLRDAAELLRKLYDSDTPIVETRDYRNGDVLGAVAHTGLAQENLQFAAVVTLHEGLFRYSKWFRAQFEQTR